MTPLGIRTGRALSSVPKTVSVNAGATGELVPGAGGRVALSVALPAAPTAALDGTVAIGYLVNNVFCPLSCLSSGHPACYLSVDKIGVALFGAISARNGTGGALVLGVVDVTQTQEFE